MDIIVFALIAYHFGIESLMSQWLEVLATDSSQLSPSFSEHCPQQKVVAWTMAVSPP